MPRVVIIGGVAAGTSAASQAKRRQPMTEVVLLERGPEVSYGACGIPYSLQDPASDMRDLIAISAEKFRSERNIDVRTGHQVLAIEPEQRRVRVRELSTQRDYDLDYDSLVISTGAQSNKLSLPGGDLPGVFVLRELSDGERIQRYLGERRRESALLIGSGYIGMELAETLHARGLSIRMLERASRVLPGFAPEIAKLAHEELSRKNVQVETGIEISAIERDSDGQGLIVRSSRGELAADMVVIAVGVHPNVSLAKQAGIQLGKSGAIAVDNELRTNLPNIWAAGDCAEAVQLVSGESTWVPLGTTANKQGKIAGANATGVHEIFHGIVASAVFKVFDMQIARTGLSAKDIERLKLDALASVSEQPSRAASFGFSEPITTLLYAERGSERLLGAQMAGRDGVGQRIDVFATALHARMTLGQIEALDLAYAPPFAPVYDPILVAATVARKAQKPEAAK